jgi:PAS domain S-box-containing protein
MNDKYSVQGHHIDLIMVEDSAVDAELIADSLKGAGLAATVRLVEDEPAFRAALEKRLPDAILSDWSLPNYSGRRALATAHERCPDIPFIFVSGTISESTAFEALREGAIDYVFKHQLHQLGPALTRALNEAGAQRALRESEFLLRTLLQNIPELVWLKDANGVFMLCNRMVESLYGAKEADITGKTDYDFVDRELADSFRDSDQKAMAACKPSSSSEWVTFADNGRRALLDSIKAPMFDTEGKLIGILGIARDVTEHHNLEQQLRHAQKMEAVGTLAGGIAHDFNNILNVILGYGTMVMETLAAGTPSREHLNEVLIAADRAANLTKRLLVFSRKDDVELKYIDINEIIIGLQKMLVRIIKENIDFNLELADRPLILKADPGQIEHVLINLATNAKDAMREGGRLTISTSIEELDAEYVAALGSVTDGKYVLITVADTGHGMDAEIRKKIFEPFFTTKGVGEGTGLGLAISFGIIKQHKGCINVHSEPGHGTAFKIYLPLSEESASLDSKKKVAPPPVGGGNETVLVAEDDPALRQLAGIMLESFGYRVITAEDGEDAIKKFEENRESISLVLLDMIMPKKSGKEVSEEIRKVSPLIKIIFTSGYTVEILKSMDLTGNGFEFITKPYQPRDLLLKVREILDR